MYGCPCVRVWCGQPWHEGPYWTGLTDRETEGTYILEVPRDHVFDGTTPWAPGQPANGHRDDDCVSMYENGLHEETCHGSYKLFFVCVQAIDAACATGPCGEGTCINADNDDGYVCDCTDTGMAGPQCADDEKDCDVNNGGCSDTCTDMYSQPRVCGCTQPGYRLDDDGMTCVADLNGCAQVSTVLADGTVACSCEAGYTTTDNGAICIADDCSGSSPCQNGGRCHGVVPNAQCKCSEFYTGDDCSVDVLECATDNGGCDHVCHEVVGGAPTCSCLSGFTTDDAGVTCVAATCPDEFPWEVAGQWCVKYDDTTHRFAEAVSTCEAAGGNLLSVSGRGALDQLLALLPVRFAQGRLYVEHRVHVLTFRSCRHLVPTTLTLDCMSHSWACKRGLMGRLLNCIPASGDMATRTPRQPARKWTVLCCTRRGVVITSSQCPRA